MRNIKEIVENWCPPPRPGCEKINGNYATLERLSAHHHTEHLHASNAEDDAIWDYLPYGPFSSVEQYRDWVAPVQRLEDPYFYAIKDKERDRWCGVASYLRIAPEAGSIEVGHINFAPRLQKTPAATEAMYLMMKWAFEAGYRRYEWKCDAANLGSRRAATRLGLSFEGVFRQASVVKGRNRDTAWFAAIDAEWPALDAAFQSWFNPDNFDAHGRQRTSLRALTDHVLVHRDPLE